MVKIAIIDDEEQARKELKENLVRYEKEENVAFFVTTFTEPITFLKEYDKQFDIIFLDVEMPDCNGIKLAKKIRKIDSQVIIVFVTNFGKYAIDGYEVDALDFIVKPVTYYGLKLKIKRAVERLGREDCFTIDVNAYDKFTRLMQKDIYYVEVREHGLFFHTTDGVVRTYGSLKKTEDLLDKKSFSRCNHCYLVNLRHIKSICGFDLTLTNGEVLQISRSKRKPFSEAVDEFVRSSF